MSPCLPSGTERSSHSKGGDGVVAEITALLFGALKSGSLYSLIALGYIVVYLATGAINFAQGELVVMGGLIAASLAVMGLPVWLAVVVSVVAVALFGWLADRLVIRPLGRGAAGRIVLVTIGLSVLMRQLLMRVFGPDELAMPGLVAAKPLELFGARLDPNAVVLVIVALSTFAVVIAGLRFTRTGKAMLAAEQSAEGAELVGVEIRSLVTIAFMVAGGVAAIAGSAVTPVTQMAFDSGLGLGIKGFTVAIFGGLTNPLGALGAGLIIGLLETVTATYFDPTYKDAVSLVILIIVLIVRPQGLFSSLTKKRRG